MSTKPSTPADIESMSLTEMTQLRKDSELRNLIYHYNTTRNKDTDPCVYVYEGGNLMHPSEDKKYSVYFEKRGETREDTPPVVRFNTVTEVRTFIIALLSLRGFTPAQG
jgi:hypothetical protein